MKQFISSIEQITIVKYFVKWFLLVIPVAVFVGSLVALFLYLLDKATQFRWEHSYLLFFLPVVGVGIALLYKYWGKNSHAGNNLVIEEIHKPGGGVPFRMAPFILITTVITHLFGGSAGREGTAVQIGGSLASFFARTIKLSKNDTSILLMTGIAAGFGAVFGTPLAGTIFALEVLVIGRIKYDALLPCFMAAVLANLVCTLYGIQHTIYHINFVDQTSSLFSHLQWNFSIVWKILIAGICFGLVSVLFTKSMHGLQYVAKRYISNTLIMPFVGGIIIIALTYIIGTTDYLGLGVQTQSGTGASIVNAFTSNSIDSFAWLWKLIFTVVTLSLGFKGGEVTPLFFIGATLGNTIAILLGAPLDLFAAIGFVAVFAGATKTPIACTIMAVELFGTEHILYFAIACFIAYVFSGKTGIYSSQKVSKE